MAEPIQYAETAETLADFFPNVDAANTGQVATIERLLVAASTLIDRYTDRPPGYFAGLGTPPGTKQKINIAIDAEDLLTDGSARLTLTADGLANSPLATTINFDSETDDSETIAAALLAAIGDVEAITDFFDIAVGDDGVSIDLEVLTLAPVDPTLSATVEAVEDETGLVPTTSTVIAAGSYNVPTVRRYRGNGSNFLRVGRYVPGTATIDGFTGTEFYEASNGWLYATDTPATAPGGYDSEAYAQRPIRLFADGALYLVSAAWGFDVTPADIVAACKMIAQHIWDRGQGTFGQVTPAGFVIERDVPPPVRLILDNWKRKEFELN